MMNAADQIRNNIIDKLLAISNQEYLNAIFQLLDQSKLDQHAIQLSEAQLILLKMSDADIQENRIFSQEEVDQKDIEWLKGQ